MNSISMVAAAVASAVNKKKTHQRDTKTGMLMNINTFLTIWKNCQDVCHGNKSENFKTNDFNSILATDNTILNCVKKKSCFIIRVVNEMDVI